MLCPLLCFESLPRVVGGSGAHARVQAEVEVEAGQLELVGIAAGQELDSLVADAVEAQWQMIDRLVTDRRQDSLS
jgi:hypothetical protein